MDAISDWRRAFPLQSANAAADALLQAWDELASPPRSWFNSRTKEPALTKRLKIYVQDHVARQHGLLGMWAAEDTFGDLNLATGELKERRTDIVYGWNDDKQQLELVFEFKRLGERKRHRKQYLGKQGLARYVTGIYSRRQPVAAMVGILLAPQSHIVPHIRAELAEGPTAEALRLRVTPTGQPLHEPSTIFPKAMFDTEHDRDQELAPPHGYIRVSHFFVAFDSNHLSS